MAAERAGGRAWTDRERVMRTLTFWLRPAFVLRALNRFQRMVGFDRAVALASSGLTAIIPLALLTGAVLAQLGVQGTAARIIKRYELTGDGADAVRDVFSPTGGTTAGVTVLGTLLVIVAVLSFSRAMQRLFEQAWELPPLSVRNSLNGLWWAIGLVAYAVATAAIDVVADLGPLHLAAAALTAPVTTVFLVWSGVMLSGRRIAWRDLAPFGVIGGVLVAAYSVGATVWVPHMFDSYAARYGAIGAVFAMISALVGIMLVVVASAAIGREVHDELERIRSGRRPPDDEIRREWDSLIADARTRFGAVRGRADRIRGRRRTRTP